MKYTAKQAIEEIEDILSADEDDPNWIDKIWAVINKYRNASLKGEKK